MKHRLFISANQRIKKKSSLVSIKFPSSGNVGDVVILRLSAEKSDSHQLCEEVFGAPKPT